MFGGFADFRPIAAPGDILRLDNPGQKTVHRLADDIVLQGQMFGEVDEPGFLFPEFSVEHNSAPKLGEFAFVAGLRCGLEDLLKIVLCWPDSAAGCGSGFRTTLGRR
jgi:hypothetical protein